MEILTGTSTEGLARNTQAGYRLYPCYPNPFDHSTTLSYSLLKSGRVVLAVFDMFGREIKTLVNEVQSPDKYSVHFDASSLPSGIYFYRFQVGEAYVDTGKMFHSK